MEPITVTHTMHHLSAQDLRTSLNHVEAITTAHPDIGEHAQIPDATGRVPAQRSLEYTLDSATTALQNKPRHRGSEAQSRRRGEGGGARAWEHGLRVQSQSPPEVRDPGRPESGGRCGTSTSLQEP